MKRNALIAAGIVIVGVVWMAAVTSADDCVAPYRLPILKPGGEDREMEALEARVKRNPDGGLDLAELAGHYLRQRRMDEAERAATRSLANLPFHNVGAKLVLAELAEARHDFEAATRMAAEILKERPRHEGALSILVTANLGCGRVGEASKAADQLAAALPRIGPLTLRALVAVAKGDLAKAEKDFKAAIKSEDIGEVTASSWTRTMYGRTLLRSGRWAEARGLFHEALRLDSGNWQALWHLAQGEAAAGDLDAAELHYGLAWQISKEPPVLADLAKLTKSEERFAQAIAIVREEIKTTPFGHRAELARILMMRGRAEDAKEALELAEADAAVRQDAETMATLAAARSLAQAGSR